jgi:hypothetical protein
MIIIRAFSLSVSMRVVQRQFFNSRVFNQDTGQQMINLMVSRKGASFGRWTLCYSGTIHGWNSYTFHANCGWRGKLVVLVFLASYILLDVFL